MAGGKLVAKALRAAKLPSRVVDYTDPPSKKIEDWKWRPLADVARELDVKKIPPHVKEFGDYMIEMAEKAKRGEISDRDLIKAYTTTRASIQRRSQDTDKIREASGLPLVGAEEKIRPEGAWSEWLMSPAGQQYLDKAVKGEMPADTVESALSLMRSFGLAPTQINAMDWAAKNLPGRGQAASDLVYRASQKASPVSEWRDFTSDVAGVGSSKSGFLASLLGRGDLPTLDARQVILNTGLPTEASQKVMARSYEGQKGFGAQEGVDRLAARQEALDLKAPQKYDPFYQHLTHHTIWDKASGEKTTHADIMNAMRNAAVVLGTPAAGAAFVSQEQPDEQRSGFADGGGTGKPMTIDEIIARIRSGEVQLGEFDPRIPQLDANRAFQPPGSKFSNQALPIVPTVPYSPDETSPRPVTIRGERPQAAPIPMPVPRPADNVPAQVSRPQMAAPVERPAADDSVSRALWTIYNESESPADFLRADAAMRAGRAEGGRLLPDDYPTSYMPDIGRQVMADGGEASAMGGFMPPQFEEAPDDRGERFQRALQNYRNFPQQRGEATAQPLGRDVRDVIGGAIAGDASNRSYGTEMRRRAADLIAGSTGMRGSGTLGFGIADAPLVTGLPLMASDIAGSAGRGDYAEAALGAALPAAFYARKPIGKALGAARDALGRVPAPVAAGATGAAVMSPEEAEAAKAKALAQAVASARAMARAKELGYDTSKVWYHSALNPIEKFEPHGKFMGRSGVSGIHLTDNPKMANRYLERFYDYDYKNQPFEKNVMPVFVKTENVLERDEPFKGQISMGSPVPDSYRNPLLDKGYDALLRNEAISGRGNVKHVAPGSRGAIEGKELVLTDPAQVRSIYDEYAEGGSVEQESPGLVDRAMSFLSQFNPVGSAEASPASAIAKRVMRGTDLIAKDPKAADVVLSKRDLSGSDKTGMRVKDVEYAVTPKGDLQPYQRFNPEDMYRERGYVIPALGDRSAAGRNLEEIGGVKLTSPVSQQGGGEFMRSTEDPAIWASRKGPVKSMYGQLQRQMKAQGASEDAPIFMSHTLMGYPSLDSTNMMAEAILRQIQPTMGKIDPKAAAKVDKFIKNKFPDWPGILNPEEAEQFLRTNEVGKRTSTILQALDKADAVRGGLPNLGAARFATMDPRLVSADQLSSGFSISRLNPRGNGAPTEHGTYTAGMGGNYRGGTDYQIPARLMYPDWFNKMNPEYLEKKSGKMKATSPTMYQQGLLTQFPLQKTTQEWLDNIMAYTEREGKKWGYRDGGFVYE
jgi:hypothetical protein